MTQDATRSPALGRRESEPERLCLPDGWRGGRVFGMGEVLDRTEIIHDIGQSTIMVKT